MSIRTFIRDLFLALQLLQVRLRVPYLLQMCMKMLVLSVFRMQLRKDMTLYEQLSLELRKVLLHFVRGFRGSMPVDSFVTPEPWAMPGYDSDVIMAARCICTGFLYRA